MAALLKFPVYFPFKMSEAQWVKLKAAAATAQVSKAQILRDLIDTLRDPPPKP